MGLVLNDKRIIMFCRNNSFIYFYINNDKLMQVRVEDCNEFHSGDIVMCKIEKNKPDISGYFVNLGNGIKGLLQYEDINDNNVKQGQDILVQVVKEAHDNKVCVVSTYIELQGAYSVVSINKNNKQIGVSKKISADRRNEILEGVNKLNIDASYSVIVRTSAENAEDKELLNEINNLSDKLSFLIEKSKHSNCYTVFYKYSYIDLLLNQNDDLIITACDKESYDYLLLKDIQKIAKVDYYAENNKIPASILYGLGRKLENITSEKVYLDSGAYLFINVTPALTVIDVNSGKSAQSRNKEEAIFKTNLEAVKEIVYQIGARNISGIIIIDFINMKSEDSKTMLINESKKLFQTISPAIKYCDITKLGLMEATREKKHVDIYETMKKIDKNILR